MVEMVPAFERATGHKVSVDYYTANQVIGKIKAGEAADLVIITRPTIDGLIKEGKIVAGSDKNLGRSGVGVAIQGGIAQTRHQHARDEALLDAKSITFTKTGEAESISSM